MKAVSQRVEVLSSSSEAPLSEIKRVASACYQRTSDKSPENFVKMLLEREHYSPLRFVSLTLDIRTSRTVSMQLLRHTTGFNFMQESQRYVSYDRTHFNYIIPIDCGKYQQIEMEKSFDAAIDAYCVLRNCLGTSPQNARSVLPNATATNMVVQGNLEAWRNFLQQRLAKGVQPCMRHLAREILLKCYEYSTVVFEDLMEKEIGE